MRNARILLSVLAVCFCLLLASGCTKPATVVTTKTVDGEHSHSIGPNGGLVAGVGLSDELHVELVIDKKNQYILFYILDKDEKTRREIPIQLMEAICLGGDSFEHTPIVPGGMTLESKPGSHTKDSLFFGNMPVFEISQVILKLKVGEARYTVKWDLMPQAKPTGEEAEICLKPGGLYTTEDIKANGNTVPSVKYKGMVFPHNKAMPGDKLCPITGVKADERCWWIIGGERRYYCCPPCATIDVKRAKEAK